MITKGHAYVDDLTPDQVSEYRGSLDKPGRPSPFRDRAPAESLDLFRRMRAGEFPDSARTLRAKIDMSSPNPNLRDPVLYRILRAHHHRTGDTWCIYPMYDFAHGQCDALEKITHSICTLEFEIHRPLYDWFLDHLPVPSRPRQIEFARLNVTYTVLSKRKLLELVKSNIVDGWDDPRMPTLRGVRRRGYPAEAIRAFCSYIGVARTNSRHSIELLESFIRRQLNEQSLRRMAVLRPLELVITNWPDDADGNPVVEHHEVVNNPENLDDGVRMVPFSKVVYIERDDFMEVAPPKYFRLTPGREVRLRSAYLVTCTGCVKDDDTR